MLLGYILRYTFTSISSIAFLPNNLPNVPSIQVATVSGPEHDAIVLDMISSDDLPRQEQGIHVLDLCNALPQQ